MKATEVHKIARKIISPWCKENGFKRVKSGMASWFKPFGKNFIVFWFQCSREGWDSFAGSKFVVEFQISEIAKIGYSTKRWRFSDFLNKNERKVVIQMQNIVIAKLEKPSKDHFIFQTDTETIDWYLEKFEFVENEYDKLHDIWFRYHDYEDVENWMNYINQKLPEIYQNLSNLQV